MKKKIITYIILLLPSIITANVITYECRDYYCFEEFEERYGITNYNATEISHRVFQFSYDPKDTFQYKQLQEKLIKEKALEKKKKQTKKNPMLDLYEISLKSYKNKEYQSAYKGFKFLFERDLNNVNVNFFLGQSSFFLKKYDEAILAYERVLFEKPSSSRAKFQLAVSYLKIDEFVEAKKNLLELQKDSSLDVNVRNRIKSYLDYIESKTKKHFYSGIALIGINYDSNINSDPDGLLLSSGLKSKVEDGFSHQEVLLFNHRYNINDVESFKNDVMLYNKSLSL